MTDSTRTGSSKSSRDQLRENQLAATKIDDDDDESFVSGDKNHCRSGWLTFRWPIRSLQQQLS